MPEDNILHSHHCENLNSYLNSFIYECEVLMVVTEEYSLLGCNGMQLRESLTFQRDISLPSSRKKLAGADRGS
jgi:hypothetical protein